MLESQVTANGRTTLPKAVREAFGVRPGGRVRYFVVDGEVRIRAVRPIQHLYGALSHDGPPVTLDDMQRAIVDGATDR
ncbi:MAG: AbrB/MazE/SpoVT family DNA-binding domain-containing protein [Chloroflexi bacterium]|nr:AbrB/MazE/SpoVT family DNA-binding domain-containing protein [Chloroflexota bacterium]